jgi:hypothetical protein
MGVHTDAELLCVNAEIVTRILFIPKDRDYVTHPKYFVKYAIKSLLVKETKENVKDKLRAILEAI